jgi:hypothetical protein
MDVRIGPLLPCSSCYFFLPRYGCGLLPLQPCHRSIGVYRNREMLVEETGRNNLCRDASGNGKPIHDSPQLSIFAGLAGFEKAKIQDL